MQSDSFENRSPLKRVGIYLLLFFAVGMGGGVLIYVINMQLAGWSVAGRSFLFSGSSTTSAQIVLYESESTRRFFSSVGANYEVLLQPWRVFAKAKGLELKEIKSLENVSPVSADVLVLPSAVALDDTERAAIQRYQREGGSLLFTWAAGTRDGAGQWRGWDFLKQIAGVSDATELPRDTSRDHLFSVGEGPLTLGLDAGTRIRLGRLAESPVVFRGGAVAALAASVKGDGPAVDTKEGLLVFQEPVFGDKTSRLVLMGAAETSWEYQPDDMHALMFGALEWLARQPVVVRSNWPNGLASAYTTGIDVDSGFSDALRMGSVLKSAGFKASYYVLGSSAKTDPMSVRNVHTSFEVGYRSDPVTPFKGQPADVQLRRAQSMVEDMSVALGNPARRPLGLSAAADTLDDTTAQALYGAGIRYYLSNGRETKSSLPFFRAVKGELAGERFVGLPQTVRPGSALLTVAPDGGAPLENAWAQDFLTVKTLGGVGVLSLTTQEPGSALDLVFPRFLGQLKGHANAVWITDAAGIAKWWSSREQFQIRVRPSASRYELDVSVVGAEPFDNGALIVSLARKGQLPTLRGLKLGMPEPVVGFMDDYRALIRFGTLPPGNYSYQLAYER